MRSVHPLGKDGPVAQPDYAQARERSAGKFPDHHCQAHVLAVLLRVDARPAAGVQLADFFWNDHPAITAEDADVLPAALAQHVHRVSEELQVPAR